MKPTSTMASAILLLASCGASAQGAHPSNPASSSLNSSLYSSSTLSPRALAAPEQRPAAQYSPFNLPAFSRVSFGAGISSLGIAMQVSTNLNEHLNLRAVGNIFKYSDKFTIDNVPASGKFNLASAGGLVDYYPFHVGFRISGGLLFVNQNRVNATANIPGGDSITLNGTDYYSASANSMTGATPLFGQGGLALNKTKPGFMVTTGWGNHVKRSGHWSVPVEIGVAFVGTPKVTTAISGWACTNQAQTLCTNIADPSNPIAQQFQSNLNAQVAKWNNDIRWLKSYPIVSTGIAYSFGTRRY